jgi:hypothetical protein
MTTDLSPDEQRRTTVLSLAVNLIGEHKGYRIPEDSALHAARSFEEYLKGDQP